MLVKDVMKFLEVMNQTMTITEAKDWLTDTWTIPHIISGIPLSNGWICFLCQYSCIGKNFMRTHCSVEHKGLNTFSQSTSCKVQKIFKGQLEKCLKILKSLEESREESWKKTLNLEFQSITIIPLVNPSLTVTNSLIWRCWGCQMAGDAWHPQMAVSEPPWLLVNPTGPN